jgi:hypothetical protein
MPARGGAWGRAASDKMSANTPRHRDLGHLKAAWIGIALWAARAVGASRRTADQSSKLIRRSSLDLITQLIRYPLSDSAAGTALFFSFLEKTCARSNPENRILAAEWRSGFSERIRASQRSDRRVFSNHVNKTKISASGVERAGGRLPRQIGPVVTSHQPTVPQVTTARP